jgi:hypothetical protein
MADVHKRPGETMCLGVGEHKSRCTAKSRTLFAGREEQYSTSSTRKYVFLGNT